MLLYLRKGEKNKSIEPIGRDYIPFSDQEYQRAKEFLESQGCFDIKEERSWYSSSDLNVQFSEGLRGNKQVQISSEPNNPILKGLIEILQPEFYLCAEAKKYPISNLR